jgi:polysaccharide biosynthesis protein VpsQ
MTDSQDPPAPPPRCTPAWLSAFWLLAIVALSATASTRPRLVLQWTQHLPGRDKTGHFLLMGGFAGVSVLAFAGRRLGARRVAVLAVLLVVTALVVLEECVQLWLPYRTFSLVDLASSLAGVACFGALAALWRARGVR